MNAMCSTETLESDVVTTHKTAYSIHSDFWLRSFLRPHPPSQIQITFEYLQGRYMEQN
jgi:hypothetical protein